MASHIHFTSGEKLALDMPASEAIEVLSPTSAGPSGFISIVTSGDTTAYVRHDKITHVTEHGRQMPQAHFA